MRGRAPLILSLALNATLLAVVWVLLEGRTHQSTPVSTNNAMAESNGVVRTNVVVRRQNFVWSEIESEDYDTYIANLRLIGCPESTIRDIIVAEVTQLYARRRAAEVITAPQQWWRSEPDPALTQAAVAKVGALEQERRGLLTRLLGPDWESADYPLPSLESLVPLDGPILGALQAETKLAVQRIEREALERQGAYLAERQAAGEAADPAELARLRSETRAELAAALPPAALEEYLLRYSQEAIDLRRELEGLEATPEEFRSLFRALDPLDQELGLRASSNGPIDAIRREELMENRENAVQQVLGPERYEEYLLWQDPLYRQARAIAESAGAAEEQIVPVAAIYRLTQLEEEQIRNDVLLSAEQKAARLEEIRIAQEASLQQLLGEEAYQRYLRSQSE